MALVGKLRHLGRVVTDSRWWPFYLQRRFMHARRRDRLASFLSRNFRPSGRVSFTTDQGNAQSRIAALTTNGITTFGTLLSNEQAAELERFFLRREVHDPYRPDEPAYLADSPQRNPLSHVAHHNARDIVLAPHLMSLANRPDILSIVSGMLGCKPTLSYLAAWWSFPTAIGAQQAENFHRDVDDWRFVKLFVYLTDVGPENGPHIYVTRSVDARELRTIGRFTDETVRTVFGQERVLQLTGSAGEGFLENTFGIHKGQPVRQGRRLMFQAVYSMFPLPYGPRKPVAHWNELGLQTRTTMDPWVNRLYVDNR